jgi:hypothetical protein
MRSIPVMVPLVLLLCAAVPDRAPTPSLPLTAEETTTLDRREVVVRFDEASATGGGAVGVIDVSSPIEATWKALLDVEARVGEIGGLSSCTKYLDEPTRMGARWEVKVLTTTVVFHVLYELDPASRFVRFRLDPSKPNDLVSVNGAYHLLPAGADTRLFYWSETDSGRPVPKWVARWLANDSLGEQLTGIRGRAERTASR